MMFGELAGEPGQAFPVAEVTITGRAVPSSNDVGTDRPGAGREHLQRNLESGQWKPISASRGAESLVTRCDFDHGLVVGVVVGDDVIEVTSESRQPLPIAPEAADTRCLVRPGFDVGADKVRTVTKLRFG